MAEDARQAPLRTRRIHAATTARARLTIVILAAVLVGCGDDDGGGAARVAPALVVDATRDTEQTNDFLRITFLPASVDPTTLGGPSAVRVFAGASTFFRPALALAEVAAFFGLPRPTPQDLIAMRCQPEPPAALDARLASWPAVFEIIQSDLGSRYVCPPADPANAENAVYCIAQGYTDVPDATIVRTVSAALVTGTMLFADQGRAEVVRRRYGIYPAFSDLGLAIKGSGEGTPLTAREALVGAVSAEYLLLNATLEAGGCRCIRVADYDGRDFDPLDVDFIRDAGTLGHCRSVPRLRFAG